MYIMKKRVVLTTLILAMVLLLFPVTVYSQQTEGHTDSLSPVHDMVTPRGACMFCWSGSTYGVCLKEINYKYAGTHGYGAFWQNTCSYELYSSHMVYRCRICYRDQAVGGQHDCLETHRNCGKGAYVICYWGR